MRIIQTKTLPHDWLQQVSSFDLASSTLSVNAKEIARRVIEFIQDDGGSSLMNPLAKLLVLHVVFGKEFLPDFYDSLPVELIRDGMIETKGEKGFNFTRKLHSVFIEFLIFKDLISDGFKFKNIARTSGSCDLVMEKNNIDYNFEVKFKESEDIFKSRLFNCIDGMSLLDENAFLRGAPYEIQVKSKNVNYNVQKEILIDIENFIVNKKEAYEGKHIDIFNFNNRRKVSRDVNKVGEYYRDLHISQELTYEGDVSELIQKMLIDDGGHLTKLIDKSKRIENFNGCLVWDVPFHKDINCESIKRAFKKLKLDFDLYVFVGGVAKVDCNFLIRKQ